MRRLLRWLGLGVAVLALGICGLLARLVLPEVPPSRTALAPATTSTATEAGVRWMPGIGPRKYGPCTRILSIDGVRIQPDLGSPPVPIDDGGPAALQRMREATQREMFAHAEDLGHLVTMLSLPRSPDCGPKLSADYERPDGPRRPLGEAGPRR